MTHADELVPEDQRPAHAATVRVSREAHTATITADGDIDASNAVLLVDAIDRQLPDVTRLIVDCSGVTFFAVEGYSVLQRINVMCAQSGTTWILVPSIAVSRVLRVCNPGGALVPAGSPNATVRPLRAPRARPLRLIRNN